MDDCKAVLRLMELGRLGVEELITHRVPAREAARAYGLLKEWDPGLLGVVLEWK